MLYYPLRSVTPQRNARACSFLQVRHQYWHYPVPHKKSEWLYPPLQPAAEGVTRRPDISSALHLPGKSDAALVQSYQHHSLVCTIWYVQPPFIVSQSFNHFVTEPSPAYKTRFPEGGYPPDIRPPEESSVWIFRDFRMEPVLVSLFRGDNAKIRQFYSNDFNSKQPC